MINYCNMTLLTSRMGLEELLALYKDTVIVSTKLPLECPQADFKGFPPSQFQGQAIFL